MTTIVKSQAEYDAALSDPSVSDILVDPPKRVLLSIFDTGGKAVRVGGSATIQDVGDSATIRDIRDSATIQYVAGSATIQDVGGSATIQNVRDSATIQDIRDSATIQDIRDSATIQDVRDSATIQYAKGTAVLHRLLDRVTVSNAGPYVTAYVYSGTVTVNGGRVIDFTEIDRNDIEVWAEFNGTEIVDGEVIVYKAVDESLHSQRGFAYPIGETVEASDRKAGDFCGAGLHLSPSPREARDYFYGATRFLRCAVPVDELSVINGNGFVTPKLKARRVPVLSEVTIDGEPVT